MLYSMIGFYSHFKCKLLVSRMKKKCSCVLTRFPIFTVLHDNRSFFRNQNTFSYVVCIISQSEDLSSYCPNFISNFILIIASIQPIQGLNK